MNNERLKELPGIKNRHLVSMKTVKLLIFLKAQAFRIWAYNVYHALQHPLSCTTPYPYMKRHVGTHKPIDKQSSNSLFWA